LGRCTPDSLAILRLKLGRVRCRSLHRPKARGSLRLRDKPRHRASPATLAICNRDNLARVSSQALRGLRGNRSLRGHRGSLVRCREGRGARW